MNKISSDGRAALIGMLVEGNRLVSITRSSGVSINTVRKLLVDVGTGCAKYHNEHVRNLNSRRVQPYDIWSFVYAKANKGSDEKHGSGDGNVWTWTAIDTDSKLIVSYLVGRRDAGCAYEFMQDVAARLTYRVQLITDGDKPLLSAGEDTFGTDIDYAQLVKIYGTKDSPSDSRYDPPKCLIARTPPTMGNHDTSKAFSKKIENHKHSIALHFMHYNFCRMNKSLRATPAMEAGISSHVWSLEQLANLA
jgi:hypothetical protein